MTVETLVAEIVELTAEDEAPDERDLAVRHELPVETVRTTISNLVAAATYRSMPALYWCMVDNQLDPAPGRGPARDRLPRSLALLLAQTAERVRSDPAVNFEDGAVRAATAVLRTRLDDRMPVSAGAPRDATEGS